MPLFLKRVVLVALLLIPLLTGRNSSSQVLPSATPSSPSATSVPADPLGRQTPSGTLFGFLQAAQSRNYERAAQYLQMSPARRQSEGEELATKLKLVLDRAFVGSLPGIGSEFGFIAQEGASFDRQKIGTLAAGDVEADLIVVRVSQAGSGRIWLISSETLAKVPDLYEQVQARQVETHLPDILVKRQLLGIPLWQWLALLLAVPIAGAVGWLIAKVIELPVRARARLRGQPQLATWRSVSAPVWLCAATVTHQVLAEFLRLPLLRWHYYLQVTTVVLIIGANWILWRVIRWLLQGLRNRMLARGRAGTGSLILLTERLTKVAVFILAALSVLGSLGFNMSTALAGLGIGGLAIGFGAQKTIENLFGGVSVLGDEVIRVGDTCRLGDRTGVVEDISLRSTRIRTDDRTVVAIPNGTVATINVENLSRRDKILFNPKFGLRYETSADQLRYVLAELRRLLYAHPKVETASVSVRFSGFQENALRVEISCYILTRDFGEFTAVREDLLLRIMDVVSASGTSLALPAQTLHLTRDSGLDQERTAAALRHVQHWRDEKQLPFPDFAPEDISSLRGSIVYPEPGSVIAGK